MYQFHNENREISFDSYNTPTPWMNYLSNGTLHAMISQAGGGVAWYKSPQIWRINHYRFFHLPTKGWEPVTRIHSDNHLWLVMDACHQLLPMIAQKTAGAERYKAEPYVYSSNIFGPESDKFGLANVSWLTGTAAWMYLAATQYILGIRPTWDGLEIDPCLPEQLLPAKVTRVFRGCRYEITITKNQKLLLPHVDRRKQLTVTV